MINLLKETLDEISDYGLSTDDIIFIGSSCGEYSCTFEEFRSFADHIYDNGYGAPEVATDLIIVFANGHQMYRHEYDGAEAWNHSVPFRRHDDPKPITSLFANSIGWENLAEIHGGTE